MGIKKLYLPGKEKVEYREYKYVQITGNGVNKNNFGVISENFIIVTPKNEKFYRISYSKDILGWRMQIEKVTQILHLTTAKIEDGEYLQIEEGDKFKLEECLFERYNFYNNEGALIKDNVPVEKGEIL